MEGEWKLQGQVEGTSREFAMREWGENGTSVRPGEWDLRKGNLWEKDLSYSENLKAHSKEELNKDEDTRKCWCCDQLTEISVFICIFAVFNICFIATGGIFDYIILRMELRNSCTK